MKIAPHTSLKHAAYVAVGAMVLLLLGAVVFYKERMLFGDATYIAFNIVNSSDYFIQERRYGSYITQSFPYLGTLLNVPIKAILIAYSVSFNLFYLAVTSLLVMRWRQYALGILAVLYYFLFVTESYFWTNNEIHQAVACMFLFWGVIKQLGDKKAHPILLIPIFVGLTILTLYTHLVVIIPFLFLWVYFMLDKEFWPFSRWQSVVLSLVIIAVVIDKYFTSINQNYDGPKLKEIPPITYDNVIASFSTPVIEVFLNRVVTLYWPAIIIFVAGLFSLLWSKKIFQFMWVLLSITGYVVIMGLTYGKFDENYALFHIESEWASISFLISAPFVFVFLRMLKARWATMLVVAIVLVRIGYIGSVIPDFRWHTTFKQQLLDKMKEKEVTKLALYNEDEIRRKIILDWALAEESMFLSLMNGDKLRSFRFVNPDDTQTLESLKKHTGISSVSKWIEQPDVNSNYFLIDTVSEYIVTDYETFMK